MTDVATLVPMPDSIKERLAAIVAAQGPRLRAFIRRQVDDLSDVEDIVQEVFEQLTITARLTAPIEHVAAWLQRVARNRIIDRYRARGREAALIVRPAHAPGETREEADPMPEELAWAAADEELERQYLRDVLLEQLADALAELPDEQREVFIAHELNGTSFKELSAASGVGINTLLARKHAAVLHLRRRLQGWRNAFDD